MNVKRYAVKTDHGRTIINKNGIEIPSIARSSKKNWNFWKFISTLSLDELRNLITIRKQNLKYETNEKKISEIREEILLLTDTYKIKKRNQINKSSSIINKDEIYKEGYTILNVLGFSNCKIYFSELCTLLDRLFHFKIIDEIEALKLDDPNVYVAVALLSEIFNYYDINIEENLIKKFSLDPINFYKLRVMIHLWCVQYYWKK